MKAWHFCNNDMKLGYYDNREIKIGEALTVDGEPKLCKWGLHGSVSVLDALKYAPGNILCLVEIDGNVIIGDDKIVGNERTTLVLVNVKETLIEFARKCALQVIHLWDCPEIVKKFLETGDVSLARAAWTAADAPARAAWTAADAPARAAWAAAAADAAARAARAADAAAAWAVWAAEAASAARAVSTADAADAAVRAAWAEQENILLNLLQENHPKLFEFDTI